MAELKTFLIQIIIFILVLVIGAAVFKALEEQDGPSIIPRKPNSSEILTSVVHKISSKYNITIEDLSITVGQLRTSLENPEGETWNKWSFSGSYFFAGTVAFTIGFGHQTPETTLGQATVILYSMIAIPIAALLLSACGQKMADQQQNLVIFIEAKLLKREPTYVKAKTLVVNTMVLVLFLVISSLMIKYYYDGWSAVESLYFLWICMTTIGFGDYIINDGNPYYEGQPMKTVMLRLNIILLVIGLCQVSCILVSIQDVLEANVERKVGNENNSDDDTNKSRAEKEDLGEDNGACGTSIENIEAC